VVETASIQTTFVLTYADTLKMVTKVIIQFNFIMSGLPESMPTSTTDDIASVVDICGSYLHFNVKPRIVSTKRLGKATTNNKYKRLLVVLNSQTAVSNLLECARQLCDASDRHVSQHVFINKDMSIEEERLAFERRQLRRNPALNTKPPTISYESAQVSSDPIQEATKSTHNDRTFYRTTLRSTSSLS